MKDFKLKKLDKVIIIVILILNILPVWIVMYTKTNNETGNIVIKVDNKVEKEIPLNNKIESKIYEFYFNNVIGYVEVKNGKVRMIEMDKKVCPNAICSDTGWISESYQSIVCLPNNIVVTIEGNNEEVIDSQTY